MTPKNGSTTVQTFNIFFPHLFLVPQELDLPAPGGIHDGFAWRCFPLLGLELKFFGVDGFRTLKTSQEQVIVSTVTNSIFLERFIQFVSHKQHY